jgi:activator of 2-hydroxyglutaryl-CoA dehydratase
MGTLVPCGLLIPQRPHMLGALGAALIAAEQARD